MDAVRTANAAEARRLLREYYNFITMISPPNIFDVLALDEMSDEEILKLAAEHSLI